MKRLLLELWRDEAGVVSFEWTLLITLLVIGVVSGLTAARDAIIDELGDLAQAAGAIDQSFSLAASVVISDADDSPPNSLVFQTNPSVFTDSSLIFTSCSRVNQPIGQPPTVDDQ